MKLGTLTFTAGLFIVAMVVTVLFVYSGASVRENWQDETWQRMILLASFSFYGIIVTSCLAALLCIGVGIRKILRNSSKHDSKGGMRL